MLYLIYMQKLIFKSTINRYHKMNGLKVSKKDFTFNYRDRYSTKKGTVI